jgi:hypothetical protein
MFAVLCTYNKCLCFIHMTYIANEFRDCFIWSELVKYLFWIIIFFFEQQSFFSTSFSSSWLVQFAIMKWSTNIYDNNIKLKNYKHLAVFAVTWNSNIPSLFLDITIFIWNSDLRQQFFIHLHKWYGDLCI